MNTLPGTRPIMASSKGGNNESEKMHYAYLKETKARMEIETLQKQEILYKSKGQAQITSTTAMSITNVALLKSVIDRGRHNSNYYEVSLVLISLSLVLQVLAGLIALTIEHSLSYLNKYRQHIWEDARESCYPWRCVRQSTNQHHHCKPKKKTPSFEVTDFNETNSESSPFCGICPCKCTAVQYEHYDTAALRMYSKWERSRVEVELKAINVEESLQSELDHIQQMKRDLKELKTNVESISDRTETENSIEELSDVLKQSQQCRDRYGLEMQQFKIFEEQGRFLRKCTDTIKKDNVMRMATFWQYVLSYIFYVIFTLNALIAGFGLAASPTIPPLNVSNIQE